MSDLPKHLEQRRIKDAREFSPSAERNIPPLVEKLSSRWPKNGKILEIGSGTGQHAAAFCRARADISWQPTDPDPSARSSQNGWASEAPEQIKPALDLDVLKPEWWGGLPKFDSIFCANMIHIAPSAVVKCLAEGAEQLLNENGAFYLYGPFQEGNLTAQSNLDFDESLKRRNFDWGVRHLSDVKHIFATRGLNLSERITMPKENRLLALKRSQ